MREISGGSVRVKWMCGVIDTCFQPRTGAPCQQAGSGKYEPRTTSLAVKYRLRQALRAIVMGLQYIVLGLVNERRSLPEQDQDSEQPGKEAFVVRVHIRSDYRTWYPFQSTLRKGY